MRRITRLYSASFVSFALVCLAGCSLKSPAPQLAASVAAPRAGLSGSIQTSPAYVRAEALFQKKDYRGALAAIDAISGGDALTESDRTFLGRQREICLRALTGGKAAPARDAKAATLAKLADCGPRALAIVATSLGVSAYPAALAKTAGTTRYGTSLEGLTKAARECGLQAEGIQADLNALKTISTPAVAWVDGEHYLAVLRVEGDRATVRDPNKSREEVIETEELLRRSGGILLLLRKP